MCWIFFWKKDLAKNILDIQFDRWLDSLWLITKEKIEWNVSGKKTINDKIKDYNKKIDKVVSDDLNVLLHHRKASVGAVTLDNTHPFKWEINNKKVYLMQNWTAKYMHSWWLLEWAIKNKQTDSEALLRYIEKKWDWKYFVHLADILDDVSEISSTWLWIVFLVINWKIFMYADWMRECHIEYEDETKENIKYISNYILNEVTYDNPEYNYYEWIQNRKKAEWSWWIVFNFDWKVILNVFEDKASKVKSTNIWYNINSYTNYNYWDDFNDLYYWTKSWREKDMLDDDKKDEYKKDNSSLLSMSWMWLWILSKESKNTLENIKIYLNFYSTEINVWYTISIINSMCNDEDIWLLQNEIALSETVYDILYSLAALDIIDWNSMKWVLYWQEDLIKAYTNMLRNDWIYLV